MRGIIFDMDGVIVDTERFHNIALKQFCEDLGKKISDDEIIKLLGKRNCELFPELFGKPLTQEEISQYEEHKEQILRDILKPHLKPIPGLLEFLEELQKQNCRIALATSAYYKNIDFIIDGLGIRKYFHAIVGAEDVTKGKPHPEPFLLASKKLGLTPKECLVFEDSEAGIKSAKAAGCYCIALTTTLSRKELIKLKPLKIIDNFKFPQ